MLEMELIEKAISGDKNALGKLIIQNKTEYYKLAYSFTFNEQDAMDAISDMTVILLKKIKHLKDITKFKSYSNTILVNCCKRIMKKTKITFYLNEEVPVENKAHLEEIMDLKNAILKLPMKYQEVVILRYFDEFDYQMISEYLAIPLGTVKSRINKGIHLLEKKMGGYDFE